MEILIKNQQRQSRLDEERIRRVVYTVLSVMKEDKAEVSILFVGERRMQKLNYQYRGIKKGTDVLSFEGDIPLSGGLSRVLGDVVVNIHRVKEQAIAAGIGFYDELSRILIHGILHLLGYDHDGSRDNARLMREKEQEILSAIKKIR